MTAPCQADTSPLLDGSVMKLHVVSTFPADSSFQSGSSNIGLDGFSFKVRTVQFQGPSIRSGVRSGLCLRFRKLWVRF